ncbi:MAG: DUF763 domain-containing protein [Chloroflexi bacterium]|nr:DUF763 domain-containing protein [Chloroflexota bacterium]
MRTGVASLPLHYGRAPRWLFERMVRLARGISQAVASEYGPEEMLYRLSDPFWFQALGCILGFDWHSSGVTTTVCGALKEALKDSQKEVGLFVAGGKGRASRRTPTEIRAVASSLISIEGEDLVYASRMAAKVDSVALQDGYQIYHHTFFFTAQGQWTVVQQGMNEGARYARRYHWLGEGVADFVCEPHAAICAEATSPVLNLVAQESADSRLAVAQLSQEKPSLLLGELARLKTLELPPRHYLALEDIDPRRLERILLLTYEERPPDFEALIGLQGVGPKTVRALTLLSELMYGAAPSFRDPARYSFAHGGKDGHPYPVDRKTYDETIQFLERALRRIPWEGNEASQALKRLHRMVDTEHDPTSTTLFDME